MKLTVDIGPNMSRQAVYIAFSDIADMLKGIRAAGKSSVSNTELPEGCDAYLSEAIQAIFAAQRTME